MISKSLIKLGVDTIMRRLKYGCDLDEFKDLETGKKRTDDNNNLRLNLIIGTVDKRKMYGGIATALNFFFALGKSLKCDLRMITIVGRLANDVVNQYDGFTFYDGKNQDGNQIVDFSENHPNREQGIPIRKNDVFISTTWVSMHYADSFRDFQKENYGIDNPIIYLIQDYEPGFNRWSSRYILADSTYKTPNVFAVFNSKILFDYFNTHGYKFAESYFFDPCINKTLKNELKRRIDNDGNIQREKVLIIYGRPQNHRNCFSLIVASLKLLIAKHPELKDWSFVSIGAKHKEVKLSESVMLVNRGKLSLEEYADILLKAKVGISLMCSPHPSYPPLEMATFGVRTVTNSFECKDLSTFSKNTLSVDRVSVESLTDAIWQQINNSDGTVEIESDYFMNESQFDSIVNSIHDALFARLDKGCE